MSGELNLILALALQDSATLADSVGFPTTPLSVATSGARLHKTVTVEPGDTVLLWERLADEDLACVYVKTSGLVYLMPMLEPLAGGSGETAAGFSACDWAPAFLPGDDWRKADGTKMRLESLSAHRLDTDEDAAIVEVFVAAAEVSE